MTGIVVRLRNAQKQLIVLIETKIPADSIAENEVVSLGGIQMGVELGELRN